MTTVIANARTKVFPRSRRLRILPAPPINRNSDAAQISQAEFAGPMGREPRAGGRASGMAGPVKDVRTAN